MHVFVVNINIIVLVIRIHERHFSILDPLRIPCIRILYPKFALSKDKVYLALVLIILVCLSQPAYADRLSCQRKRKCQNCQDPEYIGL